MWGGLPVIGSYFLQAFTMTIVTILTAAATVVFSMAIWTLNHEFRSDPNAFQSETLRQNGDFVTARRFVRRRIWIIAKILCQAVSLFTWAVAYYRFFP
jgi:hypothetical protein